MAKAIPITRELVTTAPDGVTLQLTQDEAQTLTEILASIGGDPRTTARRHAQAISSAMQSAGYHWTRRPFDLPREERAKFFMQGEIFFCDNLPTGTPTESV